MKISSKDKKLLYIVSGLILFVVLYMYVFQPKQQENAKMLSEIQRLEKECRTLEMQYGNLDVYESKIEEDRAIVKETLELFPAEIKEEDIVAYLLNLQDDNEIEMMSIAFQEPLDVVGFNGLMVVEEEDQTIRMNGRKYGTVINTELTYEDLKTVIQYIYDTATQTTLEKVTVVYNEDDDMLSGSMELARYTLSYDGAEYVPEELPDVTLGQDDLFGDN